MAVLKKAANGTAASVDESRTSRRPAATAALKLVAATVTPRSRRETATTHFAFVHALYRFSLRHIRTYVLVLPVHDSLSFVVYRVGLRGPLPSHPPLTHLGNLSGVVNTTSFRFVSSPYTHFFVRFAFRLVRSTRSVPFEQRHRLFVSSLFSLTTRETL